jgi:hypothetical protein
MTKSHHPGHPLYGALITANFTSGHPDNVNFMLRHCGVEPDLALLTALPLRLPARA